MKRSIIAAMLALFVVGISVFGQFRVRCCGEEIINSMETIERHLEAGDRAAALNATQRFLLRWEKMHGEICLYLQHDHLDPLENVFSVLPFYVENDLTDTAIAECRLAAAHTQHILRSERISYENLL